jgi:hypothetical protein
MRGRPSGQRQPEDSSDRAQTDSKEVLKAGLSLDPRFHCNSDGLPLRPGPVERVALLIFERILVLDDGSGNHDPGKNAVQHLRRV